MNIEHANAIPLPEILSKIGANPSKERNRELWYLSPFRIEKTPSLHINQKRNVWYDFGAGIGGDAVAFVCAYLKSQDVNHNVSDALRWIRNMVSYAPCISSVPVPDFSAEERKLVLKAVKPIKHLALIKYLEGRGIPLKVGAKYLKEVRVVNRETKKSFFALGFKNEDGGYEVRNPFFKGCISPKTISFVRGEIPKPAGVHLFEGFMDYLSVITQRAGKPFADDAIILNSLSCMKDAAGYIKNYGYRTAYSWLDNDAAGNKAVAAFAEFFGKEDRLQHVQMNQAYLPHVDVNAWHMHKLGL